MSDVYMEVYQEPRSERVQLAIGDDTGGYRIFGPKFLGESRLFRRAKLTAGDVGQIRYYLDKVETETPACTCADIDTPPYEPGPCLLHDREAIS